MEIKIYQINRERDNDNLMFMNLKFLEKKQGDCNLDSSIYDCVYEGKVDCKNLEDVFRKFNTDHPAGYKARSLSVSDVVEVVKSDKIKSGFYFCDSFGFKEINFEPSRAETGENFCKGDDVKTISVLLVKPNEAPRMVDIEDSLLGMQKVVGGNIESYMPFDDEVAIICNEEGKLTGLPLNRAIYSEDTPDKKQILDIVAGTFFIAYAPVESENYLSLPKDLANKYMEKFKQPERFSMTNKGIKVIPIYPKSKDVSR